MSHLKVEPSNIMVFSLSRASDVKQRNETQVLRWYLTVLSTVAI